MSGAKGCTITLVKKLMSSSLSQMPSLRQEKLLSLTDSVPLVATTVLHTVPPAQRATGHCRNLLIILRPWTRTTTKVSTPNLALLLAWEVEVTLRTDALLSMLSIDFDFLVLFYVDSHSFSLPLDPVHDGTGGVTVIGGGQQGSFSWVNVCSSLFPRSGWKLGGCQNFPSFGIASQLTDFLSVRAIAFFRPLGLH